ncbi:alpha/beta hydrolase [Oryzihumus leptocrescens]|uniref:Carboxylesterase n=1 Tax=Oryzihumus leptocrescens TaxID=297536 RepID=A0A542ZJS7_9MICO|nr:alpha/beta fold hydrolase [Oryzihumus leptocrescens]TQL60549.1 carboxylesterase [Oryzihumus leptocrescens]
MAILPGAEPFSHDGSDVGVLLVHGFTGTPQSLRPWAEHLAEAGYTVRLPRLPGHGTTWQEMNRTEWSDWYATVDATFRELLARCRTVFVAGLSMGGALALQLAQNHGPRVAGLVLVNPAVKFEDPRLVVLPVLKHLVGALPGIANDIKKADATELAYTKTPLKAGHSQIVAWRTVIRDLPEVTQPVLLLHSPQDHVVPASSSALVLSKISSEDVQEILLENSYHVATLDNDAPLIFAESVKFIERLTS